MTKRFFFAALAVCLLLMGCVGTGGQTEPTDTKPTASGPVLGYDAQNKYRGVAPRVFSFQETEDFFCGSGFLGKYIYYYDKASGISGVLCADPSCTHDSSDCGAYADYGSFFYSGEKCYWVAPESQGGFRDDCLWRGDLSGTNREIVKRFDFDDVIAEYNPQHYEIHRGNFYMLGQKNIVDGVNTCERITLGSTPLDSSEEFTLLFDETFDRNVHPSVRFVGDDVYLTMQIFPTGGPYDVTILKFDTESGEVETVYEETGMAESIDPAWVTEQGEIYLPGRSEESACIWKLENGKRVEVFSWEYADPSCPSIMDGIAVFTYQVDGVRWVDIINLSGEMLYSGKLFPEGIPGMEGDPNEYSCAEIGGDADKIILNLQTFTGNGLIDYTIMLDLNDNLKATVLWSSQR